MLQSQAQGHARRTTKTSWTVVYSWNAPERRTLRGSVIEMSDSVCSLVGATRYGDAVKFPPRDPEHRRALEPKELGVEPVKGMLL